METVQPSSKIPSSILYYQLSVFIIDESHTQAGSYYVIHILVQMFSHPYCICIVFNFRSTVDILSVLTALENGCPGYNGLVYSSMPLR